MENAEERKKMKKIEKEEQLKKKLEQTMEEKMAADSKTVEGESAVVKAEEGNTATEQEPEAAPALSEEELNAMYERFQQRLQKEGLADAEGNPTEKTLDPSPDRGEKGGTREASGETEEDCEESENNKTLGTDGKGGWCCAGCGSVRFWGEYDERGESDSVGGDD